jgi:hypothetical protein
LQAIIRGRVAIDAAINWDGWRGYDGLVDVGYAKHYRVNYGANEFVSGAHHVNGIESFWSYAKRGSVRGRCLTGADTGLFSTRVNVCNTALRPPLRFSLPVAPPAPPPKLGEG